MQSRAKLSFGWLTAVALTLACEGSSPKSDAAPTPGPTAATAAAAGNDAPAQAPAGLANPGVQPDGKVVSAVAWFEGDFEAALAAATAQDKRLFVDVGAYWCPPCHRLDEELFVLDKVGKFLADGYIAVHLDAEQGAGPELVERYDVQAYPTMLVLESSGVERGRIVDFVAADAFFEAMSSIDKGDNVLAALDAAAAAAPKDAELAYKAGHAYAIAAKRADAERHFATVLAQDPDDAAGLASKVLYDRAMFFVAKLDDAPQEAVAAYRDLQKKFPKSASARRAHRQIGRQLNKLGQADAAIASLDAMLALAPKDTALRSNYGWFSFRQKCKPARGLEVVLEGLESAEDDADLHYLAAELSAMSGDPKAGLVHIKRAAELEPKRAYYQRQVRRFEALATGKPAAARSAH